MSGGGPDWPRFVPFAPGTRVRAVVEEGEPPAATNEVVRRWEEMRILIPRLYDAPVLSVIEVDAAAGVIRCRRDTYQRLVVQPEVRTGVEQLSVTGILAGRDEAGERCVLLGERSAETRMYAGMWELGPAGGIEVPQCSELDHEAIAGELVREVREECGLEVEGLVGSGAEVIGLVHDPVAHSYDIVMVVELGDVRRVAPVGWEYERVRWARVSQIPELLREEGESIIAPTRVLLEAMRSEGR